MGRPAISLQNRRFGRWLVLERDVGVRGGSGKHTRWLCACDCGHKRSVSGVVLTQGGSNSCGCLQAENVGRRSTKHGMYGTPEYETYISSVKRARKIRATPPWADMKKIRAIYNNCPDGYEVDHIVPLGAKNVCGLHCEFNLQYLTPLENQTKKNKFAA